MAWQLRVGLSALRKTKVCISASMQSSSQVFVTPAPRIPRPLLTSAGTDMVQKSWLSTSWTVGLLAETKRQRSLAEFLGDL